MEDIALEIIKKAQSGDRAAFDAIITHYRRNIVSLCIKYMRNEDEAYDLAQDVFCSAYGAIKGFKADSKLSTWLYRIAVNHCINALDKLKRRHYFDNSSLDEQNEDGKQLTQLRDKGKPVDEEMELDEFRAAVLKALADFPQDDRKLIMMRDIEGMDYPEMAQIMQMKIGSVKSKISRAREKLKEKLLRKTR